MFPVDAPGTRDDKKSIMTEYCKSRSMLGRGAKEKNCVFFYLFLFCFQFVSYFCILNAPCLVRIILTLLSLDKVKIDIPMS